MNLNELSVVSEGKRLALLEKIKTLKINPSDIEESFVRGSGKGGQKINKTASAVMLVYKPLGIIVKMQRERERSVNRFLALRELVDEIELKISPETSPRLKEQNRIRRQKDRRHRRSL
ncbi:MAG: peptide chain release factor family protein [Elusimicrobiota bacterium]